ncbi:hypothetical protein GCM10017673_16860 [Streptosporangium violaceochromogenes]|nr:hypothetical protein GCM10017673_16860 [Streptosporangium violaceochromogenes]
MKHAYALGRTLAGVGLLAGALAGCGTQLDPEGQAIREATEIVKRQAAGAKWWFASALRDAGAEHSSPKKILGEMNRALLAGDALKTFDASYSPGGLVSIKAGFGTRVEKGGGLWYTHKVALLCAEFGGKIGSPNTITMANTPCPPRVNYADKLYLWGMPDVIVRL